MHLCPPAQSAKKDIKAICEVLRRRVLRFWCDAKNYSGNSAIACSIGNIRGSASTVRDASAGRRERLAQLLDYMSRHPFNPKSISYNAATGTVRYAPTKRTFAATPTPSRSMPSNSSLS